MLLPNIILQHGSIIFTFQRAFYQSSQSARGKFLFSYLSQTFAVSFKQKNRGQKRPPFAPFSPRFFPEISLKKFCFLRITFISCRLLLCVFLFASPAGQKRYNFDHCFIFQGQFFHFCPVDRNREVEDNLSDPVAIRLLFRE